MSTIYITMGDPAGIGPYVLVEALSKIDLNGHDVQVIGNKNVLEKQHLFSTISNKVGLIHISNCSNVVAGISSPEAGKAAYEYLQKAIELLKTNPKASLVTAPVSKESISQALGRKFIGHTEYLANAFSVPETVMLMSGKLMRVVLLTRHIPIRDIDFFLNSDNIRFTVETVIKYLNSLGIARPKIAFCSLNPHAGIETFLEKEEELIISAVKPIEHLFKMIGPYPSDTLFSNSKEYDLIVAVYHDQAMIPFKLLEFQTGVNVTLGLPFIRTSPAHGTAFNLVEETGKIDSSSMVHAIKMVM